MLQVRDLSVRLDGKEILKDISFALRPNRLTVLVGRNGSGKSTLLSCVNRQIRFNGTILAGEENLANISPRERAKLVAFLPQQIPAPHITAREMVSFGRNPYLNITGRMTDRDKLTVAEALEAAGAAFLAERYVDTLSGGERQRVALAMILAQDTPLLLLDEPTSHMDLPYEAAFLQKLVDIKTEKTVLVVLHDLSQAVRYADDILVLDRGTLVFAGTGEECLAQEVLERTFSLRRFTAWDHSENRVFFTADGG